MSVKEQGSGDEDTSSDEDIGMHSNTPPRRHSTAAIITTVEPTENDIPNGEFDQRRMSGDERNFDDGGEGNRIGDEELTLTNNVNDSLVIEKDGKFQMISTQDITAEDQSQVNSDEEEIGGAETERGVNRRRQLSRTAERAPRSKSAYSWVPNRSTHCLSEEDKQRLEKQRQRRLERERQEEEKRHEEEEKKKERCDAAFDAWLRKKRAEAAQRRKEEKLSKRDLKKQQEEKKEQRESAFNEWLRVKREQKKREEKLKKAQEQEVAEEKKGHTKRQCARAFRKWLRRKRKEARMNRLAAEAKAAKLRQQQQQQQEPPKEQKKGQKQNQRNAPAKREPESTPA